MLRPLALPLSALEHTTDFAGRHIGIDPADEQHMLSVIGAASRQAMIEAIVPRSIARARPMVLPEPVGEVQALTELKAIAAKNRVYRSYKIGRAHV